MTSRIQWIIVFSYGLHGLNCSTETEGTCSVEVGSCEGELPKVPLDQLDFVQLAEDLDALNRSAGSILHPIRRVPCSGDWYFSDEPVILEGCCWALGSAFSEDKKNVPDCSNDEDFLPIDYFQNAHAFFSEHCGDEDVMSDTWDLNRASMEEDLTEESREVANRELIRAYNVTLDELFDMFRRKRTFNSYVEEGKKYKVTKRPHHLMGHMLPLTIQGIRPLWCDAVAQPIRERGYPVLSLFRQLPQLPMHNDSFRELVWDKQMRGWIAPAGSFGHPPHLHHTWKVLVSLATEGKKHWQFMPGSQQAWNDLAPFRGLLVGRYAAGFQKPPLDVADRYRVLVGTHAKGDVIIHPRGWVHYAYNIEASATFNFILDPDPNVYKRQGPPVAKWHM